MLCQFQSLSTNSFLCVFLGASIIAAQSTNRAIVALEGDQELYEELLQPLQVIPSDCQRVDPSQFANFDDDEETLPQQGAVNLCE